MKVVWNKLINIKISWISFFLIHVSFIDIYQTRVTDLLQFNKMLHGYMIRTLVGISLDDCWANCEQRASCKSINYERRKLMCTLNSDPGNVAPEQTVGYVFAQKSSNMDQVVCGQSNCTGDDVCDIHASQCERKECRPLKRTANIYIEGNRLSSGSRTRIRCREGYAPLNGTEFTVTSLCQNGAWSKQLDCVPLTCKQMANVGITTSGMYGSFDEGSKEVIEIYCEFRTGSRTGYTYLSPDTLNPSITLSNYYTRLDHVMLRHITDVGQYESKMEPLPVYRGNYNVSAFISIHPDFNPPTDSVSKPFMYIGFVPRSYGDHKGQIMGYTCNDQNNMFQNSDGNANNYFVIFENTEISLDSYKRCWSGGQVHNGWKLCSTFVSEALPGSFFFEWYEIHMGGGGCLVRNCDTNVKGMAFGLPFDY